MTAGATYRLAGVCAFGKKLLCKLGAVLRKESKHV